jgi:hypothetical protein
MAFEKSFENNYNELSLQTKYRFAEIEISRGMNTLTRFYRFEPNARQKAAATIYNAIVPNLMKTEEFEDRFYNMLSTTYFNQPNKNELIHYLIMKGHSYTKIRNLTSASFNTISKMRYGVPTYFPIFNLWSDEMLNNWNDIKGNLNLFNEDLAHCKD